jgi:hypothetical protein
MRCIRIWHIHRPAIYYTDLLLSSMRCIYVCVCGASVYNTYTDLLFTTQTCYWVVCGHIHVEDTHTDLRVCQTVYIFFPLFYFVFSFIFLSILPHVPAACRKAGATATPLYYTPTALLHTCAQFYYTHTFTTHKMLWMLQEECCGHISFTNFATHTAHTCMRRIYYTPACGTRPASISGCSSLLHAHAFNFTTHMNFWLQLAPPPPY